MIGLVLAAAIAGPPPWSWPPGSPMPVLANDFMTVCAWTAADPDWSPRRAKGQGYLPRSEDSEKTALAKTVDGEVWTVDLESHVEVATAELPEQVVRSCVLAGVDPDNASLAYFTAWAGQAYIPKAPVTILFKEAPKTGDLIPVANDPAAIREALQTQGLFRFELSNSGGRAVLKASFSHDPMTARPSRSVEKMASQ